MFATLSWLHVFGGVNIRGVGANRFVRQGHTKVFLRPLTEHALTQQRHLGRTLSSADAKVDPLGPTMPRLITWGLTQGSMMSNANALLGPRACFKAAQAVQSE